MPSRLQAAARLAGTILIVAIITIIAVGGAYLASTLPTSSSSSYSVTAGNNSSNQSTITTNSSSSTETCSSISGGPVVCTSCSPSPCPPPRDTEQMTTINGSTFVVINGTTTESVVCEIAVPPPQGIYLRLVNDSGSPISGVQIADKGTTYVGCMTEPLTGSFSRTNSSGWAFFAGHLGSYVLSFNYSGTGYNFTVPATPMAWTVVYLRLPSGNLITEICGLGGGNLTSSCQAGVTTTVSGARLASSLGTTRIHTNKNERGFYFVHTSYILGV